MKKGLKLTCGAGCPVGRGVVESRLGSVDRRRGDDGSLSVLKAGVQIPTCEERARSVETRVAVVCGTNGRQKARWISRGRVG